MSYTLVLEKFLSLEQNDQRFAGCSYYNNVLGCACALGTLVPDLQSVGEGIQISTIDMFLSDEYNDLEHSLVKETVKNVIFNTFNLTRKEAMKLQEVNDTFDGTCEERYKHVIKFLQAKEAE